MLSQNSRVTLRRDPADMDRVYWHIWNAKGETIWPFLDYVIHCVDVLQLKVKTVESRAYSLLKWYQYLDSQGVDMWFVCDGTIAEFRDMMLKRVAVNSSEDLQARRRTINLDLRTIYGYYAWLQKDPAYGAGRKLLGPSLHQITSTLNTEIDPKLQGRRRHPLIFRRAGEHSKHRLGFVPKEPQRAALTELFYDKYSARVAKRNCMIFELAWEVGWRRGSLLSLKAADFEPARKSPGEDIMVAPASQKFGYSNSFLVPARLAARILDFIDNHRLVGVANSVNAADELFLNFGTGVPLAPGTVSNIFSRSAAALGWPRGSGIHAWRRGFTNAYIERELDARIELGLDTGGEALSMSIANALGQESLDSQGAYVRDAQRRLRGTATYRDKEEMARLADENARLREEVAALRGR